MITALCSHILYYKTMAVRLCTHMFFWWLGGVLKTAKASSEKTDEAVVSTGIHTFCIQFKSYMSLIVENNDYLLSFRVTICSNGLCVCMIRI